MTEKKLLKKSGICTCVTLLILSIFWFVFSIQTSFGYSGTGTTSDLKTGSRVNGDILAQPINGSVTIYFGTQSTQGTGSMGYIGTNTAGLPKFKYSYVGGSSAIDFIGFGAVYINGVAIPSSGSVSSKIDAVGGTGTNNLFTNLTVNGNSKIQSVGTENSFLIGGNLGLGTTTPNSKLHVEGNAIISGFSEYKGTGTPPIPTAGNSRLSAVTSQGITRIFHLNELGVSVNIGRDNVFIAKNTSGGTISKGQVVYVTGSVGAIPTIAKALANSKSTCSAIIGVIVDDILNNAFGLVMINGILESFDTSAFSTGDSTWVGTSTPGLLTNVRPVHPYYQKGVGVILNSGVGNGSMLVNVAPFLGNVESGTDVPAYTFAGDASVSGNLSVTGSVNFGTTTPSPSKIPISLGTGFLNDSWLSTIITKLGQDIQLGTETTGNTDNVSEGITNKYYTDARVNSAVGSLSVNTLSDVNINIANEGDFVKIVGGQLVAGSSSITVAFPEVTGSAAASQLPLVSGLLGSATSAQLPANAIIASTLVIGSQTAHPNTVLTVVGSGTTLLALTDYAGIATATTQMTSDTTPTPNAATASSYYTPDSLYAYLAFNNTYGASSRWYSNNGALPEWLRYDFGAGIQKIIIQYSLTTQGGTESPRDWTFEGSDNLTTWTVLDTQTSIATWTANVYKHYDIPLGSQTPFRAHRINISAVQSGGYVEIVEMEFVAYQIQKVLVVDDNKIVMIGTDTVFGTTTSYPFQVAGSSLGNDWTLRPSSSKVKTDLPGTPTTEVLNIVRSSDGHKFFYKDKLVSDAAIAAKALNDYIAENEETEFELYKEVYQNEYIEGEIGSRSVNYRKMKDGFSLIHANNKKVEWDNTKFVTGKSERIKRTKAYLEMDGADLRNNTANYGIMIDRNCPAEILDANGLPSMAKWQGFNFVAIKGLLEMVDEMKADLGSATAEIEKLKAIVNP